MALTDGRRVAVPLSWYPRLAHAPQELLERWEILGGGEAIRWPALDDDLSVEGIVKGIRPTWFTRFRAIAAKPRLRA